MGKTFFQNGNFYAHKLSNDVAIYVHDCYKLADTNNEAVTITWFNLGQIEPYDMGLGVDKATIKVEDIGNWISLGTAFTSESARKAIQDARQGK